ncbi:methylated-DNA--[protein]-cysteine S-methyltransferase [bacterium]|nr:MAG: methylated-DNA--[protein]-cysteine S-methyltransferase [bacterium]
MLAWGDENRVFAISLFSDSAIDSKLARFTDIIETGEHCDIIPTSLKQYESTGSLENLKPVILWGTPFQRKVWEELYRLPAGKLISYGELAAKIGRPRAARAVGSAVGANHIAIVIPCHRVVGKNGPGGFGGDLELKAKLLETEGLHLPKKISI